MTKAVQVKIHKTRLQLSKTHFRRTKTKSYNKHLIPTKLGLLKIQTLNGKQEKLSCQQKDTIKYVDKNWTSKKLQNTIMNQQDIFL